MRIRIRTCMEDTITLSATDAKEIIPYQSIMASPHVKQPYAGLLYYRGNVMPVTGPLPSVWEKSHTYDEVPWILVFKDHARVILGLPEILDSETEVIPPSVDAEDFSDEDAIAAALEDAIAKIA